MLIALGVVLVLVAGGCVLLAVRAGRARAARERAAEAARNDPFTRRPVRVGLAPPTEVQHFPPPGEHKMYVPMWRRARWLIAAAAVLLLFGIAGVVAFGSRLKDDPAPVAEPVPTCPDARLRVAAAPEIAPVVQAAARTLNPGGADCGPVAVTAAEPAATESAADKPDVWIPSSSAWLHIARADGSVYEAEGAPLAYSPVVLAGPDAITKLYVKDKRTSWAAVVDGVAKHRIPAVSMPDPLQSSVGLLAVHAVHAAMGRTTPDAGMAQLRALTLRSRLKDPAMDPAAALAKDAAAGDETAGVYDVGIFPVTEQQLAAYQKEKHEVALTGAAPADGVVEADYPYAISAKTAERDLATRLKAAIGKDALTGAGFRTKATARALDLPEQSDKLLAPALQWSQYQNKTFQVLLMIDTSGSMNQKVVGKDGRSTTKAALLRESGLSANQLFGEDTSIGMWFFSTPSPSSPAHREAVPVGPLTAQVDGKSRREVMGAAIAGYQATDDAGTPLFRTVLDGLSEMRDKARPGAVTLAVVLTDGRDEQSRFAMSRDAFLKELTETRDPARPVPILAMGYGEDADMASLSAMAKATGGKAIPANNPADVASAIAQAFLAAHSPS
ncbi:von Willebrand factor type A [Actinoplanes sp. N902-109]|nr:von Willebrand factor type A [Actinoplanes sp. N902-109]